MGGSVDRVDLDPLRHVFRSHVIPFLAAVMSDLHQSIIRSSPDHAFRDWRFHQRKDRAVILDAGVVLRDGTARCAHLGFVITRQIAADGLPTLAFIGRDRKEHTSELQSPYVISYA